LQENISKVLKIAIKTAIVVYFISYITIIFAYNLFQGFDKSKKKDFAIKAFNLIFDNNDIKFDISENNNLIKLENFSVSKLGVIENLQVKNLTLNLNPINILKLKSPVNIYEINGLDVLLKNTNFQSKSSIENKNKDEYTTKQAIKKAEKILNITSKIIKNDLKINDIRITKSNHKIITLGNIVVKNIRTRYFEKTIRVSSKANIGTNGNFILNCDINMNSATKKIKSISIESNLNNAARDLTKILKNEGVKNNIPIIDDINFSLNSELSNGRIYLKSFDVKSQNSHFLSDNKFFKFDNISISGKSHKNDTIILNPIIIKSKAINISSYPSYLKVSSFPELKLKFKIKNFKANDIISFFWPEKILSSTKKFLLNNNISNNKNATFDVNILKNYDFTAKFNVEDVSNQSFEKFFPGVTAKNSEITVTKDRLKIYVEKADSLKKDIVAEQINIDIDYKNKNMINLNITAKNASSDYKLLLQEMHQVNSKLYSFLPSISNILLGHNIHNSATRVLVSDFVLKIPFHHKMDNLFKDTQISLKANVPISNIQFITTNAGNYGICKLVKTKNSSSIQTNCKIQNPVKLDALNDQPSIYRLLNIIDINKTTLINVNLFDKSDKAVVAINLASSGNEEVLKIHSISEQSNVSFFASIPNNNCTSPLVINLIGENLNLQSILNNKITFNNQSNEKKCHFLDNLNLYVDLKNITTKYNKKIEKTYAKIDIKNSKIDDIKIDLANADRNSYLEVIKKEDGIFDINAVRFSKILNGLFDEPDLLYSNKIHGYLRQNGENISTDLKLEDVKFKIIGKGQKNKDISKSIIPGASVFSNYISYDNVDIDFIINKNANTMKLINFMATKTNAKLTASGDYDFGNDKINISGKVDSAYIVNRLITFEKIPALNKMITLGNKDGGYGVVNYKISGKMSELSKKSIEISGDRSSAVIAGGLFFINPLLAIPLLLNANDAKNEILDNKKT
jgi:hypothetical protein